MSASGERRTAVAPCGAVMLLSVLCASVAEQGMWVLPACTWDKGECQCHPAPPRDGRDRGSMYGRPAAQDPLSVDLELLWMLLQKAREKGETAELWKVVFVSRPCRHTVVQSLVQLDAFSHWQTPVWWRQHHIATAVSTLQALLPRGDPSVLKKQQQAISAFCQVQPSGMMT